MTNPSCLTISSCLDLATPPQTFLCSSPGTGKTPWITAFDCVWHVGLLEKLHAKGIQGHLLMVMNDYLHDRSPHVVIGEQQSRNLPVGVSVPHGPVPGPVLWNLYIDDFLRTLSAVSIYSDDCTLSRSYCCQDS
uniref:Reverse transcriptase domain-containing protein n=1 Tax=Scylla olivacea TaxID=85551 RepID=A0A0P4WCI5_SCYOL